MKLSVVGKEVKEVGNGWRASGFARIHFKRDDGSQGIAEWEPRIAYGRSRGQAEEGLSRRIDSQLKYFFELFEEEKGKENAA